MLSDSNVSNKNSNTHTNSQNKNQKPTIDVELAQINSNHSELFSNTFKLTNSYQRAKIISKKSIIDDIKRHENKIMAHREKHIKDDIGLCWGLFK